MWSCIRSNCLYRHIENLEYLLKKRHNLQLYKPINYVNNLIMLAIYMKIVTLCLTSRIRYRCILGKIYTTFMCVCIPNKIRWVLKVSWKRSHTSFISINNICTHIIYSIHTYCKFIWGNIFSHIFCINS